MQSDEVRREALELAIKFHHSKPNVVRPRIVLETAVKFSDYILDGKVKS